MGLAKYLQCTKHYEATDMRDKLYALIGVSCDISPEDIVPDYEKSTRTVFLDLVRFLVTKRRSLDIISSGRLSRPAPISSELQLEGPKSNIPSWLPDWRVSKGLRALDSEGEDGACYRAGSDAEAVVRMDNFPLVLEVEGIVVDKVDFFGGAITSPAHKSLPTLQRWKYIAGKHLDPDSFGQTAPVFWDTIVAGRVDWRRQSSNNTSSYGGSSATLAANWTSGQGLPKGSAEYKDELQRFVAEAMFPFHMTMYYMDAVTRAAMGRRFFVTKKNKMGLGVPEIQVDDRVVVVKGCSVPHIIRAVGDHMVIIGESYVSEIMDGEVIEGLARGQYKSRMIKLRQQGC